MGYKDMRGAIEETIGEKKSQETDEEILQIYHQCEYYISLIFFGEICQIGGIWENSYDDDFRERFIEM